MGKGSGVLGVRAGEAVGPALERFGHGILAEARAAMQAPGGSRMVVHDFRKVMKRWRAFLRLLESMPDHSPRALRLHARDLARELASARDVQAALDSLTDLSECAVPLPKRSQASIAQRLEAKREAAYDSGLTDDIRMRIAAYLESADVALSIWPLDAMDFGDIAGALTQSYGRARRLVPNIWAEASAEELHVLRQRVVVLRYQSEFVHPLWPRFMRAMTAEAQRLRERLGHCQDLAVLSALTLPQGDLARWRRLLLPLIAERKAAHIAAAAHHAGRLFAERPKALRRKLETLWANSREPSA
jgi:CHAD domain-containing protein